MALGQRGVWGLFLVWYSKLFFSSRAENNLKKKLSLGPGHSNQTKIDIDDFKALGLIFRP